VITLVPIS